MKHFLQFTKTEIRLREHWKKWVQQMCWSWSFFTSSAVETQLGHLHNKKRIVINHSGHWQDRNLSCARRMSQVTKCQFLGPLALPWDSQVGLCASLQKDKSPLSAPSGPAPLGCLQVPWDITKGIRPLSVGNRNLMSSLDSCLWSRNVPYSQTNRAWNSDGCSSWTSNDYWEMCLCRNVS